MLPGTTAQKSGCGSTNEARGSDRIRVIDLQSKERAPKDSQQGGKERLFNKGFD